MLRAFTADDAAFWYESSHGLFYAIRDSLEYNYFVEDVRNGKVKSASGVVPIFLIQNRVRLRRCGKMHKLC